MSDTLVKVEGLYKKFTRDLKRGLVYGTTDTFRSMLGIPYKTDYLRKKEFWALEDINFELKRGEVLGLIGRNGSGKSTLLRLLTGIFPPDKGKITMKGRVGALIAVGAGFHPHMSGRENIYLNGTILGMNRHEIKKRFEEIVEFAEIGDFIDAPVATYSSGMRVRLGFAIAAHIEPDILLIDEVLAVGDMGFKLKCLNKINELIDNTAVVFISHAMEFIHRISTKAMVLDEGSVAIQTNNVGEGVDFYNSLFSETEAKEYSFGKATITNIKLKTNKNYQHPLFVKFGDDLILTFDLQLDKKVKEVKLRVVIEDKELRPVIDILSPQGNDFIIQNKHKKQKVKIIIKNISLNSGKHYFKINISNNTRINESLYKIDNVAPFIMKKSITSWSSLLQHGEIELK